MKSTCETCGVGNSYIDVVKRLLLHHTLYPMKHVFFLNFQSEIAATFDLCSLNDAILIFHHNYLLSIQHQDIYTFSNIPTTTAILTVASTIVVVDIIGSLRLLFATNMYF